MISSPHFDNKRQDVLILVKGPTQGLEHHSLHKNCIQSILQSIIKSLV